MDTSAVVVGIDKAMRRKGRRRAYTLEDKLRVVAEARGRGASVAEVARRHGINANLVFNWRRQHQQGVLEEHTRQVKLLPVHVTEPVAVRDERREIIPICDSGRIEISLGKDIRVSIIGTVSAERVDRVLTILRRPA
jgi:transposase